MGKAAQREKDAAMAARLRDDPYHKPDGVKARKAARFRSFMAALERKDK